jgi:hypothetical protein
MSAERAGVPAVVEASAVMQTPAIQSSLAVPAAIANAGDPAARRFLEFFAATPQQEHPAGLLPGRLQFLRLA